MVQAAAQTGSRTKSRTKSRAKARADADTRALFRKLGRTADRAIREQLIERHTDLVEKVARGFLASGEPLEDLVQEGYLGLIKAVDSFDVTRDVKFTTYATHTISGEIRHYLRDRKSLIREPGWLHELSQKVARAIDRLTQDMDQAPGVAAIARETGLSEETVLEVMRTRSVFRPASLDGDADSADSETAIALDRRKAVAEKQAPEQMAVEDRIVIDQAVRKLKGLERRVIYYLFYKDFNQTEIARKLGISCNYVSHLVRTSLRRLRQMLTSEELREAHLRLKSAGARAMLAEGAEGSSRFDDVTGLLSTRAFRERLEQEVLRGARYAHPVGLVLLVIDDFHHFNEAHGFTASDGLLAEVGKLARKNVRKVDVVARYGDAGFAIILPHTGARGGHVVAKRLLEEIPALDLGALTRTPASATACAGIAEYPQHGSSQEELLEAALRALSDARSVGPSTLRGAEKP